MANKNNNLGDISKGSESLRARKINSLHRSTNELVQQQNKRRIQANNQIKEAGLSSEIEKSYNGILKSLGRTIDHLSTGVKKITVDTSKATTNAIGQYGKAVGEDININKTNTVAMALSKSTPLFGYFAAKFMETDVFKDSANKIKQNIGAAMHAGMSKAGATVGSVFNKGNKASQTKDKAASISDLSDLKASMSKDIPKLQTGGFVKEGGLAELHAAEVVTPIDKLYRQFGEIIVLQKEQQNTISKIFIKEFRESRELQTEDSKRMRQSFDELKAGIIGTGERTRITWQTTLLEHPTFRNMMLLNDILKTTIISPIKWLFGIRGGYKGDITNAMSSSNMFLKQTNILALIYTKMMPKLDNIIQYTRAQAEFSVGQKISPTKDYSTYSMYQRIKARMTSRTIPGEQTSMFQDISKKLGLDSGSLKEAGITKISDFFKAGKILRSMGFTVENIKSKYREDSEFETLRNMPKTPRDVAAAFKEKTTNFYTSVKEALFNLVKMKSDQEEREGPHSPSMAQNIASTALVAQSEEGENKRHRSKTFDLWNKIKKNSVMQSNYMKSMRTHLRKLKGRIWDVALFAMAFFKDMFFKGFGMFKTILSSIGLGGAAGAVTGFGGKILGGAKNLFGKAKGAIGLGKSANPYASVLGEAGVKTGAKGGILKGVGKFAGRMIGGAASGVIGSGMGMWDMFQAIRSGNATGFVGNFITRGIAGFLGGTDTGAKGAMHGAMKGGAFGAAVGSFIPVIGTTIGGAIGAITGGLMGFVGGKKISKGISESLKTLKGLIGGVWKLIKLPFQFFREGVQIAWSLAKFGYNKTLGKLVTKFKDWWEKPGIIQTGLHWLTNKILIIWDAIKKPFIWIADKLSTMFGGDLWKNIVEATKTTLYYIMFPLLAMKKAFKYIADKVKKIPIIGKALKGMGSFIGDIQSGELSNKVNNNLNKSEVRFGEPLKLPDDIKNQINIQSTKDVSTRQNQTNGILLREVIDRTVALKLEQQRTKQLKEELAKIKDSTIKNGDMMMQNIKNISSSNTSNTSNTINNNSGGNKSNFSNSQQLATQIALCNNM